MNAGGVDKACKSNGYFFMLAFKNISGERVSITLVTYPKVLDNLRKRKLIQDGQFIRKSKL
jgi:hypothetical protein